MTRLKTLLLAGTLVPALVLPPTTASFAQEPGMERGGPGAHGEGPRGGAEGQRGGAPGGAAHPERGAPRGEHPEQGAGGRAERPPAGGPRGAESGEGRGARPERAPAAAERREAPARAAAPAERATERPNAPAKASPAERAVERPSAPARATPAERAGERPEGRKTPAEMVGEHPGKMTPAERVGNHPEAPGRMTPAERAAEKPGAAGKTSPNERPGTPGTPPAGRGPNAGAAPAQPNGRYNDPASPQGGGFRNGDTNRGATTNRGTNGEPNGRYNDPASPQGGGFRNGDTRGNAPTGRGPNGEPNGAGQNGFDRGQGGRGQENRGQDNRGQNNGGQDNRGETRRGGISPGGAAAIGAAAGFAGGFLAATGAQNLEGIRGDRRETVEDGRTYIREPGRTIVDEGGGRSYIVHDENDRFRELGYDVRREHRGNDYVDVVSRPDGNQILTYTTRDGRMLRRVRRNRDGREVVLIDNSYDGGVRPYTEDVVDLPPPRFDIPPERYDVDYGRADESSIYETLIAPPVARPPRRYTLDQIRYSPDIRRYVRSVDINTINFASGSWIVPASATGKLRSLGSAIRRAVAQNPDSVFLVEGYTDATGNANENLSLSDHRAQSVAAILSKDFGVPPENLTTQGYGQQNLKVDTRGPSEENRRVVVQNITQLMADNGGKGPSPR